MIRTIVARIFTRAGNLKKNLKGNRYQGLLKKELKTFYNYDDKEKGSTQRRTALKETPFNFKTVQEFSCSSRRTRQTCHFRGLRQL